MLSSSLDALLKPSKMPSLQEIFSYNCMTLYIFAYSYKSVIMVTPNCPKYAQNILTGKFETPLSTPRRSEYK